MHVKRIIAVITALIFATMTAAFTSVAQSSAAANPSWKLRFSTSFSTAAPLGSFSGCSNWGADICTGLPKTLQSSWWAYPAGWPDTATERNYGLGGYYEPQRTVWISGGQMHIRMFRGTGSVSSAAVVPRASINKMYGRYTVTARVSQVTAGYSPRISCGRITAAVTSKSTSRRTIGTRRQAPTFTTGVPASFHSHRALTGHNGTPTRLSGGLVTSACTLTARSSARQPLQRTCPMSVWTGSSRMSRRSTASGLRRIRPPRSTSATSSDPRARSTARALSRSR